MGIVDNYKEYKKHYPDYLPFDKKEREKEGKRAQYLTRHPEIIKKEDKKRAKVILNAIDIMDDYSQQKAEDMENTIDMIKGSVGSLGMGVGFVGGNILSFFIGPKLKNNLKGKQTSLDTGIIKGVIPPLCGLLGHTATHFIFSCMSAKKEVEASRKGRMEAMTTELANPAQFAILTAEQNEQVKKISKTIDYKKEEKKKKQRLNWQPLKSLKTLFNEDDAKYQEEREKFDKELYIQDKKKRYATNLTEKQVNDGKRDKQILSNMVRKIDIASQEYSENIEYGTNIVTTLATVGGILAGFISNSIMKLCKVSDTFLASCVTLGVGAGIAMTGMLISTRLTKQAARVGRFKAKQDILKHPENYVYVDDEKLKEEKNLKVKPKKTDNIFVFLYHAYKDTKEYQEYQKHHSAKIEKRRKAIEKIKLSEQQKKEAKILQQNVFRTFNEVDEQSQKYSESVEALGEITSGISELIMSSGIIISSMGATLMKSKIGKAFNTILGISSFALPFGLNYYITQEQKKASKVADMRALQKLDDYKNYVNYD